MRRTFIVIMAFSLMLVAAAPAFAKGGPPDGKGGPPDGVKPGDQTIAQIVVASTEADDPEFTLLLDALEYTDLTGVFTGGGQYTVFAPTDAAFLKLVQALSEDEAWNADLAGEDPFAAIDDLLGEGTVADVLLYHVTEGRRASNSVVPPRNSRTITTLLGPTFSVDADAEITAVGNSGSIEKPNISASNGVIHVIDTVILPIDLGLDSDD